MKFTLRSIFTLVLITLTGVAGSIIVGLMRHGGNIFQSSSADFAFFAFGLSGAFIFAFYHVRGLSETITVAVVVSAIQFVIATQWITTLNASFWSFGVNLSAVLLAFIFEKKLERLKTARFLIVGLLYGAMFVLLTYVVGLITRIEEMPAAVFQENFVDGALIGLGLGIGIQGGEAFVHALETHRGSK